MVENTESNQESRLEGHIFTADISDSLYNYRILKMKDSLFVYLGENDCEVFTEMAMAMPMPNGECLVTTILGEHLGSSQELALNFAKKLKKQVYLSCNVPQDRQIRPALSRRFIEEYKQNPDKF